jgi:hypothetical protein
MIRNTAKTIPTNAPADAIETGISKIQTATTNATVNPVSAAFQALTLPVANRPNSTNTGIPETKVDNGQFPKGSYR